MNDTIIAWKNGVRKVWTRKQWDILGTDKYGWVEEPELPKEVSLLGEVIKEQERRIGILMKGLDTKEAEMPQTTNKRKKRK